MDKTGSADCIARGEGFYMIVRTCKLNPLVLLSLVIALLTITISTFILYLTVWEHGVRVSPDSNTYLRTGYSFSQGQGLGMTVYQPETDTIIFMPTTHYPPLLPIAYAAGLFAGFNWYDVPALISLISWVVFLVGIGWLTYRLSHSALIAALIVFLTTITPHFWVVFLHAWSEVLFLPLLVWLMIILVDLPFQPQNGYRRLGLATVILALLMLTRYVGVFVFAAVMLWWAWWHLRQTPKLIAGGLILSCAALPLAAWVVRNTFQSESILGHHRAASTHTFTAGLQAMASEGVSVLLPSTTFFALRQNYRQESIILILFILFVALVFIFWQYRPKESIRLFAPHRTPIFIFLLFYVALYTVAQPFFLFWPIDIRDMTTILCLSLPCLGALLAWLPAKGWSYILISSYVAVNAVFAFGPLLTNGMPWWVSVFPPRIDDVTQMRGAPVYRAGGLVSYLITNPPRTKTLVNNHPEMLDWLQSLDEHVVVFTNETRSLLFAAYPFAIAPDPAWIRNNQPPDTDEIICSSQHPMALIVFSWYGYNANAKDMQAVFEQKCPDLYKRDFQHSSVYLFGSLQYPLVNFMES